MFRYEKVAEDAVYKFRESGMKKIYYFVVVQTYAANFKFCISAVFFDHFNGEYWLTYYIEEMKTLASLSFKIGLCARWVLLKKFCDIFQYVLFYCIILLQDCMYKDLS